MRPLKSQLVALCEQRNIGYEIVETRSKAVEIRWSIKMRFGDLVVSVHLTWKNQYTAYLDDMTTGNNVSWLMHFDIYGFMHWLKEYKLIS